MLKADNYSILVYILISLLCTGVIYCSTIVQQSKSNLLPFKAIELAGSLAEGVNSDEFNSHPLLSSNDTLDHFGYSAYSGLVDYISHHLSSMVPNKYEPFDNEDTNSTATLGLLSETVRSAARSLTSGNGGISKLISNSGLVSGEVSDYMVTAEAMMNSVASQVSQVAKQVDANPSKRDIYSENDEIALWMLDNKKSQPSSIRPIAHRGSLGGARGLGQNEFIGKGIKSLISGGEKLFGDEKHHEHKENHEGHHHDHHKDEHKHHESHHDHHHHNNHHEHHHDKDKSESHEHKNVFESVSGNFKDAIKDSIENISDSIGDKKSGGEGKNEKGSELKEPGLLKGPANLMNTVLKTSLNTMKSSSKEMDTLSSTLGESGLGNGLGKLIPGAIHAMGGGVSLGEKAVEAVSKVGGSKESKESKTDEDPDADFYEDDDSDSNNNPGLFDGGKRKYFSKECRFRIACEIGRMVVSPMPPDVLKQYSDNKFLKDFQNKYTKAMTFGATRKACDRYYCVFVNMMGGPGPFAQGVLEIFTAMNKKSK